MTLLRDKNWLVSASKARFGYKELKVLGHMVSKGRIIPDKEKIEAFHRLKAPSNLR